MSLLFTLPLTSQEEVHYPTTEWRTSTPEAQGMDSETLAKAIGMLSRGPESIHSLLVIRHGYVVLDASVYPFSPQRPHWLYSGTKSVISTLAGIAIDQGYIQSVDQSIWDFFPQEATANMDEHKAAITVENLLTQSSGLRMGANQDSAMYDLTAQDQSWVQYTLDMPMLSGPGASFNYLDANAHLVSALIQAATGMSALEYAQKNLFGPLGIGDTPWRADPQGVSLGGDGLALSPYDMAKLGYLYLHRGEWDGQKILSQSWIEAATSQQIEQRVYWDGYGYFWWTGALGLRGNYPAYVALGLAGQEIWVIPDADLVVVATGDALGRSLIDVGILPAIKAEAALPANAAAQAVLASGIEALAAPASTPGLPIPEVMMRFSGHGCVLQDNPLGWQSVTLDLGENEAVLAVDVADSRLELPFGLDGVYRISRGRLPSDPLWLPTGPFWRPLTDVPIAGQFLRADEDRFTVRVWDLSGGQGWTITVVFSDSVVVQILPSIAAKGVRIEGSIE